jgi:broad specificity phosphatase PhoE
VSTLHLIRHGQASIHAEDYDVLSERGVRQSRLLGAWIAASGPALHAVYSGPRRRQRDTARHLLEAAREAGATLPDPVVLDDLDEYPAFEVLRHGVPQLLAEEPDLAAQLGDDPLSARGPSIYERVIARWMRAEIAAQGLETWRDFEARVRRALAHVIATEGRGREVAVVTSGGPISVALKAALALDDEIVLRMQGVVTNASITELKYRGELLTLARFNSVPHLPRDLVTQV